MTIKPIRSSDDLVFAKRRLRELMGRSEADRDHDTIEILSLLVEQFETKQSEVALPTPQEAIKFRMEQLGLTARQLEPYIGSRARVSEVLSGKRQLSLEMIRSLHEGLGIPYSSLIEANPKKLNVNQVSAPALNRLATLGFKINVEDPSSFVSFSLPNNASAALLRKTRTQRAASKTDQAALLLWQAAVLQKSKEIATSNRFDEANLTFDFLRKIAKFSSRPNGSQRAMNELSAVGIKVIVLPALPGTFLDGAAMVDMAEQPVIGLTLRHDRVDSFWFTLLHEISHIKLHYKELTQTQTAFVDDMEIKSDDRFEREADQLARESLIPSSFLIESRWDAGTEYDEITAIASRARVHISVVAGRWQMEHQNYKKFSRLIERNSLRSLLL